MSLVEQREKVRRSRARLEESREKLARLDAARARAAERAQPAQPAKPITEARSAGQTSSQPNTG